MQVRRIIAGPGDRVDISENGLEINGYLQQEDDIYTDTMRLQKGLIFRLQWGRRNILSLVITEKMPETAACTDW